MDQRRGGRACPGVHDKARGLFDDREIAILENDVQRDVLGFKSGRLRSREIHLDGLIAAHSVPRLFRTAFNADRS
jgi:hypothetical protein